jgi:phosphoenolpyruvate-protein phosphotransferase (PTS system enzyme I)
MTFVISGLSVSNGVAIGRALTISSASLEVNHRLIQEGEEEQELRRLFDAFEIAKKELSDLKDSLPEDAPEEMGAFLDVHQLILDDPELQKKPIELIKKRRFNAAWALTTELDDLLDNFETIEDPYLKERGADFRQVIERVLVALQGTNKKEETTTHQKLDRENSEVIIVAQDIAPHDMLRFKELNFCAFVTDLGGKNSHTAIVARSLDIPAAVGVKNASMLIDQDDWLIVDGDRGIVIVDPPKIILDEYRHRQAELRLAKNKLQLLKHTPTQTLDGKKIVLMANIEMPEDANDALTKGALGIGLFRSEFLFMNRLHGIPGEEEQYKAYAQTVIAMHGMPVNIRTIDIGADKNLDTDVETITSDISPLGLRGIRWSLSEPDIFLEQLRAILRASAHGKAQILIPMLAQVKEIEQTFELIEQAKKQLDERGIAYNPQIRIGAMIELPAAVFILPVFLKYFDFLSIGTNDLIQYTLGIDRADSSVAHLYDPMHPAVLSMIYKVIHDCQEVGKSVSICGEMAGDSKLTRLLIAMGLTDFSMHASQLLTVKRELLKSDMCKLQ